MKDLDATKKILDMEIRRDKQVGILYLFQKKYLENVLERFGMQSSKPVSTPLPIHFKLATSHHIEEDVEQMSRVPFPSVISSMMYAIV